MEALFRELEDRAQDWFEREGLPTQSRSLQRSASLRYQGQGFELSVPWSGKVDEASTQACIGAFHALHRQMYTFAQEDAPVELITLGVTAVGRLSQPKMPALRKSGPVKDAVIGMQPIFFQDGLRDCPVYARDKLGAGARFAGPGIVTQLDATTLIAPGEKVEIDALGSLLIEIAE